MSNDANSLRIAALTSLTKTDAAPKGKSQGHSISNYFGELTFGLDKMREKLPGQAYQELIRTLDDGKPFSKDTANAIAGIVRDWAVSKGATHFCHWFQPMTGLTAEKHDAFISIQYSHHSELKVLERFTGSQLIQGEPDASSFPSGGMRSTFEARGYTAWDPTSPLFLIEGEMGTTLCIPSVFFGYHGEALDHKTPLLRSVQTLSDKACEFLKLLGDVDVKQVQATLGTEQEYFLIDKRFAGLRPDLVVSGRTLLGAQSARGQRLEDHYFGAIPTRVMGFMEELEHELYRLGIPVKTRHNEVAPSQFELAPIFETANIAVDHNVLTMETMKRVAKRHGFMCLLNEKPFAEINGNGKHCNWSLSNDKGENLLDPGRTPHQNLRFLAMVAVVLRAVHQHAGPLRAAIASPGNDHRLGGNEAPPAIISVFLGSLLEQIFDSIAEGKAAEATETQIINLGVSQIPNVSKDYTDRNRTSPFAFTGNKFEFRAVGASANTAVPITVLNAAVADSLDQATRELTDILKKNKNRDEAVVELIQKLHENSSPVLFSGDNYSEEWRTEAKKRGLPCLANTPEALSVMNSPEQVKFLIEQKVLTEGEIQSRYHVSVERYVNTVEIELRTLCELVDEYAVPAVEKQLVQSHQVEGTLSSSNAKSALGDRVKALESTFGDMLSHVKVLKDLLDGQGGAEADAEKMNWIVAEAFPVAEKLRAATDKAELLVADEFWPLPKYREMLFANIIS